MLAASGIADERRQATRLRTSNTMYLMDLGMSISRYFSSKLHELGLRRQRLFAVVSSFFGLWLSRGKGVWAARPHSC